MLKAGEKVILTNLIHQYVLTYAGVNIGDKAIIIGVDGVGYYIKMISGKGIHMRFYVGYERVIPFRSALQKLKAMIQEMP